MGSVFALAAGSAVNPTLLAVVTLILTRRSPKPLLLGFLLGALLISVTCGLLLVFVLSGTQTSSTAKHTVSPILDITLGILILAAALWAATGQHRRLRAWNARRHQKTTDKAPPRWQRALTNASPWSAFVLGIVLTLPGAEYIGAMDILSKRHPAAPVAVIVVVAFTVIQLLIVEVPTVAYIVRPESADASVNRFRDWGRRRGPRTALIVAVVIGAWLVVRGVANLG